TSRVLAEGMAVGDSVGTGKAHVIKSAKDISTFKPGSVLVTEMTDPDWVPIMKVASAIVTDQGGRTCHAAIISRELGIPCIVGTGSGSKNIPPDSDITVSCSGGSKGLVYEGILPFKSETIRLKELEMPKTPFYFHESNPDNAFPASQYPIQGIGLVRMDEIIRDEVKVHPLACKAYSGWKKSGEESRTVAQIDELSKGYPDKEAYFVNKLAEGIGRIASSVYPRPVQVLLPDAPSRDLDRLVGGSAFKMDEANSMLGARGAARFTDLDYEDAFLLELAGLKKAHKEMGMSNISVILPACQSEKELKAVVGLLGSNGMKHNNDGLKYQMLVRTPAQILTMGQFADQVDGFLFDVGEIAQTAQGMDAKNVLVKAYFKEDHPAVLELLKMGMAAAKKAKKPAGLANIAPGNLQGFAKNPEILHADYVVVRSDVFQNARTAFLGV
ncbi:MAG: PEP-utilizing enzyme, partial [Deltaproteobacteria bacterium]|nr:PEP-utilizing enzyme [Deltaproteobacteria bacterium]